MDARERRARLIRELYRNGEGYEDPTAGEALLRVMTGENGKPICRNR